MGSRRQEWDPGGMLSLLLVLLLQRIANKCRTIHQEMFDEAHHGVDFDEPSTRSCSPGRQGGQKTKSPPARTHQAPSLVSILAARRLD